MNVKFKWVSTEEFIKENPYLQSSPWILKYDRLLERAIDNSKILNVTGLKRDDFVSIRDGIKIELNRILKENKHESNSCK